MNRAQMMTTSQAPKRPAAAAKPKAGASAAGQKQSSRKGAEALLARVEAVRLAQRQEGHFDCFAKAKDGYCDQDGCAYRADCLSLSQRLK